MMQMRLHFLLLCLFCVQCLSAQQLVESTYLTTRSKESLQDEFGLFSQFDVDLYKITYETPDIYGDLDTASGLFCLPSREDELLAFPHLIYQHGTVGSPDDVPSNLAGGYELALFWASVGYATSAADFLGLGEARGFHPYVHTRTEASAAIDLYFAVRDFITENGFFTNDQLFVTGYSQGGHAAAAVQQYIEAEAPNGISVTASAPMSGPYSIAGVMRDFILSETPYFFPAYAPYTLLSYNLEFDLFDDPNEVFQPQIANWVSQFSTYSIDLGTFNQNIITWLISNHGSSVTRYMFTDEILMEIESDPDHPINQALADNDLTSWAPQAPTRMYYCMADDQVPFMNSVVAETEMLALNAPDLEAIDVASDEDHGGCITPAVTAAYLFFGGYQQVDMLDAISSPDPELAFRLIPNPAQREVNIQFERTAAQVNRLELYQLNGQVLQSHTNMPSSLSLEGLSPGLYLLKVQSDNGVWVEKLIVK